MHKGIRPHTAMPVCPAVSLGQLQLERSLIELTSRRLSFLQLRDLSSDGHSQRDKTVFRSFPDFDMCHCRRNSDDGITHRLLRGM